MSKLTKKLIFKKYRVKTLIASTQFSSLYEGINEKENEPVAMKFEKLNAKNIILESEAYLLFSLKGFGIPKIITYGKSGYYNCLIEELLGLTIEKLWKSRKDKNYLTLKYICMLAIQVLDRLEFIHSKNVIYRDIKTNNLVIGRKDPEIIYLIDFGLARKYRSSRTGKHIKYTNLQKAYGNLRYISINGNKGYEQSRRDDLESLGYMLIFLAKNTLPWINKNVSSITNKLTKYKTVCELKIKTPIEKLCFGLPSEFMQYINYCRNLEFEQDPNYDFLRSLYTSMLTKNEQINDLNFFWITNKIIKLKTEKGGKSMENRHNFYIKRCNSRNRLYNKIKKKLEKAKSQEISKGFNFNFMHLNSTKKSNSNKKYIKDEGNSPMKSNISDKKYINEEGNSPLKINILNKKEDTDNLNKNDENEDNINKNIMIEENGNEDGIFNIEQNENEDNMNKKENIEDNEIEEKNGKEVNAEEYEIDKDFKKNNENEKNYINLKSNHEMNKNKINNIYQININNINNDNKVKFIKKIKNDAFENFNYNIKNNKICKTNTNNNSKSNLIDNYNIRNNITTNNNINNYNIINNKINDINSFDSSKNPKFKKINDKKILNDNFNIIFPIRLNNSGDKKTMNRKNTYRTLQERKKDKNVNITKNNCNNNQIKNIILPFNNMKKNNYIKTIKLQNSFDKNNNKIIRNQNPNILIRNRQPMNHQNNFNNNNLNFNNNFIYNSPIKTIPYKNVSNKYILDHNYFSSIRKDSNEKSVNLNNKNNIFIMPNNFNVNLSLKSLKYEPQLKPNLKNFKIIREVKSIDLYNNNYNNKNNNIKMFNITRLRKNNYGK